MLLLCLSFSLSLLSSVLWVAVVVVAVAVATILGIVVAVIVMTTTSMTPPLNPGAGEEALRASGVTYTIVRPGGLTKGPGGCSLLISGARQARETVQLSAKNG